MTNAVQILSNTEGRDNHVIHQVAILLRELCRLHAVPEPPDIDNLTLPVMPQPVSRYTYICFIIIIGIRCCHSLHMFIINNRLTSEVEPMEDEGVDSEDAEVGDSEGEADGSDVEEDLQLEMEDNRAKADEMGVEHLATLERLRQNQRQDYLKVSNN